MTLSFKQDVQPKIKFYNLYSGEQASNKREVSLYVITYENPYAVRAGERGQLSYVNLPTDPRRKALSYVGSSVGLFEIFLAFSGFIQGKVQAVRNTRYTHRTPRAK